ncbi:MAG: phosphoglucosamine mutase [Bacteroidetes bacterium]|nr:phosphoglucosamine mutase [Bacteroidota bacterium]MCL2328142.1 phosphoglucosamine mutase [Bacteroidota bacterium]
MTLIKSISGIRGTIGGEPTNNLTPIDIVTFAAAYGTWILQNTPNGTKRLVIGRDARISGAMVTSLISQTLVGLGFTVVDIDLATTPTVEIAVPMEQADGGIIVTASHNPKQWNALKLLNAKGEFLNAQAGQEVLALAAEQAFSFAEVDALGTIERNDTYNKKHIDAVCALPLVDCDAIKKANFTVAIDCVNSVGGIVLPQLFKALGVVNILPLYCEPNGIFPHNPEPLPEHVGDIVELIKTQKADVGFVVDPDVDRLAIINNDGSLFNEEYTLVAIADYILSQENASTGSATGGNTVSNLSSTRALADVTAWHGGTYNAAAVGEVNVVEKMKATNAVIGGEGNGGVIYPELHYGRDALVGIALFLTHLAKSGKTCKELRDTYPNYVVSKNKIELTPNINVDALLEQIAKQFSHEKINTVDGVKIDFAEGWVHLRKSNTEPIIRIYAEHKSEEQAHLLAQTIIDAIKKNI